MSGLDIKFRRAEAETIVIPTSAEPIDKFTHQRGYDNFIWDDLGQGTNSESSFTPDPIDWVTSDPFYFGNECIFRLLLQAT